MTSQTTPSRTAGGAGGPQVRTEVLNACDHLLDRHLRAGGGGREAVRTAGGSRDYTALAEEVRAVSAALLACGVRPEERVVFFMADGVELLAGILAAMRIGAVAVPVSTMLTEADLSAMLRDSRARILLVTEQHSAVADRAARGAPELADVVVCGTAQVDTRTPVRWQGWERFLAHGRGQGGAVVEPYATAGDSAALWLYTSGTTGSPKAAIHRHRNIVSVTEGYARHVLEIEPQDRCLSVAKLFFAYGIGNSLFFPLSVGAAVILEAERPTPAGIAARARSERPTLFFGVPTFYAALLASDVPDDSFASVRRAVSAGEPLPAAIFHRFRERFGVEILDGIGSTEALHIFISNRAGQVHPASSGTAVPGYELELRDESGEVITAADTPGGLFVRGESTALSYWCRVETSRQVFLGPWLRTGDTYQRNQDGTYTCLGRSDDMLKAGGIWVSPAEVEDRLLQHDSVAEAVVVAEKDADGLDKPVACVVARPGRTIDAEELIAHCRAGLASFKRPRKVVVLAELPRTATGKIRRAAVRAELAGRSAE